jgi:hypothetical protein
VLVAVTVSTLSCAGALTVALTVAVEVNVTEVAAREHAEVTISPEYLVRASGVEAACCGLAPHMPHGMSSWNEQLE